MFRKCFPLLFSFYNSFIKIKFDIKNIKTKLYDSVHVNKMFN